MTKILLRRSVVKYGYRSKMILKIISKVLMEISITLSAYVRDKSLSSFHPWLGHGPERVIIKGLEYRYICSRCQNRKLVFLEHENRRTILKIFAYLNWFFYNVDGLVY